MKRQMYDPFTRKIMWEDDPPKRADLVEVVRCKDCKHKGGFGCPWWKGEDIPTDWYCANGERKDDAVK